MFSCCSSKKHCVEQAVNYTTLQNYEMMRIKLMEYLKTYNDEFSNPRLHKNGKVYVLAYDVMIDPANDAFLFKEIIIENLRNRLVAVTDTMISDLENVSCVVKALQVCEVEKRKRPE